MSDETRYKEVKADDWEDMTLSDLYEQLSILHSRSLTASSMYNMPMLNQIQKGIARCEAIIAEKSDGDDSITL